MKHFPLLTCAVLLSLGPWAAAQEAPKSPPPGAPAPAAESSAPAAGQAPAPAPHVISLKDVRLEVSRGKLADTPDTLDHLIKLYESKRDEELAQKQREGYLDSFMACYCRFIKAQVLALSGNTDAAEAALKDGHDYQAQHPEVSNKAVAAMWKQTEGVTTGLILEKKGDKEGAVQAYLPASESAIATGRLALLELNRGNLAQARTWAYIHADNPTCAYVLGQIAFNSKNYAVANRHIGIAVAGLQKALTASDEYSPAFYCDMPAILALRAKIQPFLPKAPPKAAPPPGQPKGPAASKQNAPKTHTIANLSIDPRWTNFGPYLHKLIETVQNEWDSNLEKNKFTSDVNRTVTVRFGLNSKGEVFKVFNVNSSQGTPPEATQTCVSAITNRSPYEPWPDEMVSVLGKEQSISLGFDYRAPPHAAAPAPP